MSADVKPSRPGGRSALVRDAVFAAATNLLSEVGYENLQLPDVARRAGVNKTTVYRRWPRKADLIRDLAEDLAFTPAAIVDTGSLRSDAEQLLLAVVESLRAPAARALVASFAVGDRGDEDRAGRDTFWDERFQAAAVLVERAISRGELPPNADPRAFLERLVSPVYFHLFILGREVTRGDITRWLEG